MPSFNKAHISLTFDKARCRSSGLESWDSRTSTRVRSSRVFRNTSSLSLKSASCSLSVFGGLVRKAYLVKTSFFNDLSFFFESSTFFSKNFFSSLFSSLFAAFRWKPMNSSTVVKISLCKSGGRISILRMLVKAFCLVGIF